MLAHHDTSMSASARTHTRALHVILVFENVPTCERAFAFRPAVNLAEYLHSKIAALAPTRSHQVAVPHHACPRRCHPERSLNRTLYISLQCA